MASVLFADVLKQASRDGFRYGDNITRDWFRTKAMQSTRSSPSRIIERASSSVNSPLVGKMVLYNYDPKHKATLPYYDTYPLIFPIEVYSDGRWLGLNLHYLPPLLRARLLDALYENINNENYNTTTKLNLSYKILKGVSRYKYFEPCLKMYLASHVKSRIIEISPKEWDYVMFLPIARFQKATQQAVWEASMNRIRS